MQDLAERKLYIGSPLACAGWEVYHDTAHPDVDYVGAFDAMSLPDVAFATVYSTVFNRLDARTRVLRALREYRRIIRPGGFLILVVTDAAALGMALAGARVVEDQVTLTKLSQPRSAWTAELLAAYLTLAGFTNARRVAKLGLFHDASELAHHEVSLSLNVLADRP